MRERKAWKRHSSELHGKSSRSRLEACLTEPGIKNFFLSQLYLVVTLSCPVPSHSHEIVLVSKLWPFIYFGSHPKNFLKWNWRLGISLFSHFRGKYED
jgi:hypothetical protein